MKSDVAKLERDARWARRPHDIQQRTVLALREMDELPTTREQRDTLRLHVAMALTMAQTKGRHWCQDEVARLRAEFLPDLSTTRNLHPNMVRTKEEEVAAEKIFDAIEAALKESMWTP